jgi:hypothetical protein
MAILGGSNVGRSFSECTTISTDFSSRAISNSFVNKLFSPIFERALSKITSPVVDMDTAKEELFVKGEVANSKK